MPAYKKQPHEMLHCARSAALRIRLCSLIALTVVATASASAPAVKPGQSDAIPLDLSKYNLRPIYSNNFSSPQKISREEDFIKKSTAGGWRRIGGPDPEAEWIAEGWGGTEVRDGKLRVAPFPFDNQGHLKSSDTANRSHMVVWNRRIFPSNFLLEYEMDPGVSTSGLTIVLFSATGKNGEDIFDLSLPPRRADYQTYHSGEIANYSDSYWSRNTEIESKTNRLRKNPGFKLVAEAPSLTAASSVAPYRMRILKSGAHIEVEINGHVVIKWDDADKPLGAGRIGLRSMEGVTTVTYDNFKVWELAPKVKH
jgi:Domain of unknown function (DUF1961)